MDRFLTDLKWLGFQAQYCLGRNLLESKICREASPWAIGVAAFVALVVIWIVWGWAAKRVRAWLWRREQARVADKETMDSVRWGGYDPKK